METINHECYVSSEVATLLTKAGFCWQDYFVIHNISGRFHWEIPLHIAQKWLRDVHYLHITITPDDVEFKKWGWTIFTSKYVKYSVFCQGYSTYEEALEAGIKKALEIILEKGE